uniref:Cilia and flagella associated protein 99 n=1 Tax=Poecilia formosa TaxID=48698 RepID=A0A087X5V9_POEFO
MLQSFDPLERKFILDVFSGCVEYEKLLDIVVNTFYGQHRKWLCKSDRNQFIEVRKKGQKILEHSQNCSRILTFFVLTFFPQNSDFFLRNLYFFQFRFLSQYSSKQRVCVSCRWRPEINHLMDQLSKKERRASAKPTHCQDFILSKNKLPTTPKREPSPLPDKFTPVPRSTYTSPRELQKIQECKEKNKEKAEVQYSMQMKVKCYDYYLFSLRCISQSSCITTQRETVQLVNICSRIIILAHKEWLKVESHSVRLNNAAIWRREALHDRMVKEELHRIDKLVQGAVDPSPFLQRQKELEERERQEKRQAEERTRLETQIIEKEITLIRKRIAEQKHEAALRKKEETARLMQRYAEKRVKEEKEVRDLVQQVMEHRINLKVAQERSKKIKQKIVKEVSEENQELLRQALEEKEEELRKRFQIIHEIHVIESLPIVKSNKFDETEIAGHELLGEMSLAELKERLALLRQNQQKEEEERRSNILEEKQKKKQQILETLDNINLYRKLLTKEAADRKEEQRSQQELLKQVVNEDETIVALKKKLEDKKQAFHKMKEAERSQAKPGKRLARRASGQKELRETTWEELEQSLARFVQNTK